MVRIYNGILAIKRNEIVPFVETWRDLESVIQSEISQKEKNKYRVLIYMWNLEQWCRGLTCKTEKEIQMWRTNVRMPRGRGGAWDALGDWS